MLDPQIAALSGWQWIPGPAWNQPDYIVNAPLAYYAGAFFVEEPPIRGVAQIAYSAPMPIKSNQNMPVSAAKQTNLGLLNGAAPSSGIYTGIPSGCNGGMGGNPYS